MEKPRTLCPRGGGEASGKALPPQSSKFCIPTARWMPSSEGDVGLTARTVHHVSKCCKPKCLNVLAKKSFVSFLSVGRRLASQMGGGVAFPRFGFHPAGGCGSSWPLAPRSAWIWRNASCCFSPERETVSASFSANSAVGGARSGLPLPSFLPFPVLGHGRGTFSAPVPAWLVVLIGPGSGIPLRAKCRAALFLMDGGVALGKTFLGAFFAIYRVRPHSVTTRLGGCCFPIIF